MNSILAESSLKTVNAPYWWCISDATSYVELTMQPGQAITSIEVQTIERDGMTGFLLFLKRPTGELDMVVTPGFGYNEHWFRTNPFTAHMIWGSVVEREFRIARSDVTTTSVDVDIDVDDRNGQRVRMRVKHQFAFKTAPWFVPSTLNQTRPHTLRFMLADSVRMLPRWTQLSIQLDDTELRPDNFLLPRAIDPFLRARAGAGLVGVGLNESGEWAIEPSAVAMPVRLESPERAGPLIAHFVGADQGNASGRLVVSCPVGEVTWGKWRVGKSTSGDTFEIYDVSQHWFPGFRSPMRLLLYFVRRFLRRKDSWQWTSHIETVGNKTKLSGRWQNREPSKPGQVPEV